MYQNYDYAVDKVSEYLIKNQFSRSVVYSHLHCYRLFKKYLEQGKLHYSHEEAVRWLNINRLSWKHSKFKMFRLSLFQLNDVMRNGCITTNKYVYESSCNYDRLPYWCKQLLDDYLDGISDLYGKGYLTAHKNACSEFLIFINSVGVTNVTNINHKNVIEYYNQSKHRTVQAKNLYNRNIRHFLLYLGEKGLIPASLTYVLDRFVIPRIIILDKLPAEKKRSWILHLNQTYDEIPASEYYSIARELGDSNLDYHNYSKTMKKVFRKAWKELFVFLEANELNYSYKIAEYWCFYLKDYTVQWKSFRRAVKLFEQYRVFGDIKPNIVYSYKEDPINILPAWSRDLLLDFLSKKQKEGNSVSTISSYRSSCLRFLKFLDKKGIKCCSLISPEVIKDFHISDPHSTAEARNAYSVRIRQFLDYLADTGYIPETFNLALTTECAPKVEIVKILTGEEIDSIYNFRANAEKPMELRNIAMVLIGIRMGLRASDITGMKLTDISWEACTISVQQQKTDTFLKLPMPVDVGNSLYNYLMKGRPNSNSKYILISHRVPYDRLSTRCCQRALNIVLGKQKNGFHITRKTFASRMLMKRTDTNTIADSLGHSDSSTVLKYLATDSDTMRQCALSMKGLEVKGGMLYE